MRHTPEVNGASSPPLLYAECASPLETGLFPVHARWCPRGSRKGALREQLPHPYTADGPGCRAVSSPEGPWPGGGRAAEEAAAPRAPDPRGERVRPPDSAPYLDPSFQNTAPPSQSAFTTRTPDPLFIWTLYSPWTLLLYYFCLIKASPRPDATPTVSVVCSSRHTGGECGQAEPRQRSWATPMTSSPLARRNSWKPALGRRNDGDGLPAT